VKTLTCHDCKATVECSCSAYALDFSHSHWGLGATRCNPCGDAFKEQIRAERQARFEAERARKRAHIEASIKDGQCPDDGEVCPECCAHEFDPDEGGMCINGCESDGSDALAAAAESAADLAADR
jgi:hypothetical protein